MPSRTKGKLKAAKSSVKEIQLDQNHPRHALCGGGGGQQQQQKSSDENEGLLLLTQANKKAERRHCGFPGHIQEAFRTELKQHNELLEVENWFHGTDRKI